MVPRTCTQCNKNFTSTTDDLGFYEKIGVPEPTLCSSCRYKRRISNRNEWELYRRNCSNCSNGMVSIYNPEYPGPVYCLKCFWSDERDQLATGADFDFSRPFFEQFRALRFRTPKVTVAHFRCVNSDYTNQSQDLKNCYMCFAGDASEDCLYGSWYFHSRECMDGSQLHSCELLYDGLNCTNCSRSAYLENCTDCFESMFLKDCKGCQNCFGSVGLRNKSYYWFNEELSKEEYQQRLAAFPRTRAAIAEMQTRLAALSETVPTKYYQGNKIVHSTGSYLSNTKNTHSGFNVGDAEDSMYAQDAWGLKNCVDITESAYNELDYEMEGIGYTAHNIGVSRSWNIFHSRYSENCFSSNNVFGCVSLHKKDYCILNKQYSKEEYEVLTAKIVEHMKATGEWGEFFPTEISPFAYNETVAQHYFPMTRDEVLARGWRWYDRGARGYVVTKRHEDLPQSIKETDDSIVQEIISCSSQDTEEGKASHSACVTAFRVTGDELTLYRKMGMPIPDKCFPCRFRDRLHKRTPRTLFSRTCMCGEGSTEETMIHDHLGSCPREFETSYAPDSRVIVYCEECYTKEVQ